MELTLLSKWREAKNPENQSCKRSKIKRIRKHKNSEVKIKHGIRDMKTMI